MFDITTQWGDYTLESDHGCWFTAVGHATQNAGSSACMWTLILQWWWYIPRCHSIHSYTYMTSHKSTYEFIVRLTKMFGYNLQ